MIPASSSPSTRPALGARAGPSWVGRLLARHPLRPPLRHPHLKQRVFIVPGEVLDELDAGRPQLLQSLAQRDHQTLAPRRLAALPAAPLNTLHGRPNRLWSATRLRVFARTRTQYTQTMWAPRQIRTGSSGNLRGDNAWPGGGFRFLGSQHGRPF